MNEFQNWETRTMRDLIAELARIIGLGVTTPESIKIAEKFAEITVKKTFRTVASMNMEENNETQTEA